jgi:hypothetical protein
MYTLAEPQTALEDKPEADFAPCHFWCNLTQSAVGPDDQQVHKDACTASRTCYEE